MLPPEQRYHFEAFGFLVVQVLDPALVSSMADACRKLKDDVLTGRRLPKGVFAEQRPDGTPFETFLAVHDVHAYDSVFLAYLANERLVEIADELIGATPRLIGSTAFVNSRLDSDDPPTVADYHFHRGIDPVSGTYTRNGLVQTSMLRGLTNLVDLGPHDGGTVVVRGSHKTDAPVDLIVKAAAGYDDLLYQYQAPAGTTLFFSESAVHGTGIVTSNQERLMVGGVYAPPMFEPWNRTYPRADDLAYCCSPRVRAIVDGVGWHG